MNLTPGAGAFFIVPGADAREAGKTFTFDLAQHPSAKEAIAVAVHFEGKAPLQYLLDPVNSEQIVALSPVDAPGRPLGRLLYSKPEGRDVILITFNGALIGDHAVQMGNAIIGLFDLR